MQSLEIRKADRIRRRKEAALKAYGPSGQPGEEGQLSAQNGDLDPTDSTTNSLVDPTDINKLTIKQLRDQLTQRGMTAPQSATKAQLIELLNAPQQDASDGTDIGEGSEGNGAGGESQTGNPVPPPIPGQNPWGGAGA